MWKSRRKSQKSKEKAGNKPKIRIATPTQRKIPLRDISNGTLISEDRRMLKMLEVTPLPFRTLKVSQKNQVRELFEVFLKTAPANMQIKCVSIPADLSRQIERMEENIAAEKNGECRKIAEEYLRKLKQAQEYNIERRFYLVFSDEETLKRKRKEDIGKKMYALDVTASRLCERLKACGTGARVLGSSEAAAVFYMLLNRNAYKEEPFETHYGKIYERYVREYEAKGLIKDPGKPVYIAPGEYIAPQTLYLNDKNYVLCDGRYYTFLYPDGEKGYPESVVCGWMQIFIDSFEGVDTDIFFRRKDRRRFKEKLEMSIGHSKHDIYAGNDISDSYQRATTKYASARFLYECLLNEQNIYDVSVLLTISGNSIEEVSSKVQQLCEKAAGYDIRLRTLPYEAEQAFLSALPLCGLDPNIERKARRNMPQMSAAAMFPFVSFQLIHDKGLLIADGAGQTPVIPDFWDTRFVANPLVFMCGMAGAGKTSACELIALRARVASLPVYIVAPEKQDDYKRLCESIGGQFIDIGTGSPYRINIMEIFENDKNAEAQEEELYGDNSRRNISYLSKRSAVVFEFLHTAYPQMSALEQGVLKECILEAYYRKGITENNESLWEDEERTRYKKMPVLSDLLPLIKEKGSGYDPLYYTIRSLTEGAGAHFNGETNIDIHNKFFVIGTENNSKESKTLSSFLAEDFCQMKIREDRVSKTLFIIDEGWAMLNNEYTAEKMREDSKILRGYSCLFIFATQQMEDVLLSEKGQAILKNAETRIIMKHKDEDINYISQFISLSENEKKMIRNFSVGEALLLANQVRIPVYFDPTDFEKLLTWNDPATLKRYAQYKTGKRREEEKTRQPMKRKSVTEMLTGTMSVPELKLTDTGDYLKQMKMPTLTDSNGYLHELNKGKEISYEEF